MVRKSLLSAVALCGLLPFRGAGAGFFVSYDDKHASAQYRLPEPDAMPLLCQPDRPLPSPAEVVLSAKPVQEEPVVFGIDVSHYQGRINWQMVRLDPNVGYVYIKATEGAGIVDSHYRRNLAEARGAGLPVGVYHFFSPSASAMVQLRNFLENVDPRQQDLIPLIDVEKRGRGSSADFHAKLSAVLRETERHFGVRPIIYTGVNFYNEHLAGRYTDYRFMIARYAEELPPLADDVPVVMWQFTSGGSISGIQGNVDRSFILRSFSLQDILMPRPASR